MSKFLVAAGAALLQFCWVMILATLVGCPPPADPRTPEQSAAESPAQGRDVGDGWERLPDRPSVELGTPPASVFRLRVDGGWLYHSKQGVAFAPDVAPVQSVTCSCTHQLAPEKF